MLAGPDLAPVRLALCLLLVVGGLVLAWLVSRRAGWPPAGPLLLIASTPLVPSLTIGFGVSTDDILPGVAVVVGLLTMRRSNVEGPWPVVLVAGGVLMGVAGLISSIVNADGVSSAVAMALKSTGHVVFLGLIAVVAVTSLPAVRRHVFVAHAVAGVATFEAAFGLIAWLVPLPLAAGLEPTRQMTSLLGRVPGRIAGTTGLSPNFLGALFVLSLPLTAALALRATTRGTRLFWWAAVAAQLAALALTFTRTSLVLAIGALVVLLLTRGHWRVLGGVAILVAAIALATPLGARLVGDANDRAALWSSAVLMTVDHPLAGVGPGRTQVVADDQPDRYRNTAFGAATNNAHNTILLAGAETGILGALGALLINLSAAGLALGALLRGARRWGTPLQTSDLVSAAALGVLGFLVQGMTNNLFSVQVTSVVATLVLAAFLLPPALPLGDLAARWRTARPNGERHASPSGS